MTEIKNHKCGKGANERVRVEVRDELGVGGMHNEYRIVIEVGGVHPQTILRFGPEGLTNEALLAVVRHRLDCAQDGRFSCRENELALASVDRALYHLQERTMDRADRGVEGKLEP